MNNELNENIDINVPLIDEGENNQSPSTNQTEEVITEYVDQDGNPIDPSLIDEFGNYIGETNVISDSDISASAKQMLDKELMKGMVTFDYNNVPITNIVNSIILDAINKGSSDIHFDPFEEGIKIRIRIDGELNDYSIVPLYVKKNMITRIKIISGMNITESRVPQDGAIRSELGNKTVDLRVSCLPTNLGEKIVIRVMDYSMSAAGIEALDFNEKNLEKVKKMLSLPNGIILVTGATGTGKSTTVYSMLQKLNVEGTNLITVEDPIEMNIGGINQVQAVSEIGLDFATVLRSILRQDPDVIMIGEIRDDETARIAVRASITGHLVLSTIHTNNSLNTIERLLDMSVERYLLGSALEGIVSQKLSRRLCEKCKRLRKTTDYEKEIFKRALNKDIEEIYEPVGCDECSRGYRGRIAIHEVLLLNQNIRDAITNGVSKNILRSYVYGKGGTETMLQDGLEKVIEGKTSFEEILKLIDLDDDLGSGTQLGLEDQIQDSNVNYQEDEEVIIRAPKSGKKKKILEIDPEEIKEMLQFDSKDNKSSIINEIYKLKRFINKRNIATTLNDLLDDLEDQDFELKKNDTKKIKSFMNELNNSLLTSEYYDDYLEVLKKMIDIFNIEIDIKERKVEANIQNEETTNDDIEFTLDDLDDDIDYEIEEEEITPLSLNDKDNVNSNIKEETTPLSLDDKDDEDVDFDIFDDEIENIIKGKDIMDNETIDDIINMINKNFKEEDK